ncbi:hypothetical protein TNCV_1602191 [Trichonephila clavipes]|nr:hypothetical protein TNCV_1602191 [Trichonephila clavipes]
MMSDRGPRNSSWPKFKCTPVANRSFEQHPGDSTFWLGSSQILMENTLGCGQNPPHQTYEMSCSSTAI